MRIRFYIDSDTGQPHVLQHGAAEKQILMKRNRFPAGWNQDKVQAILEHYEKQTEDEAVAEDEAAFRLRGQAVVIVPKRLVPETTRLIEIRRTRNSRTSSH